jgi:hypothetical protein
MTRRAGFDERPLALGFWIDCLWIDFRSFHMDHMLNTLPALSCDFEDAAVSVYYLSLVELSGIDLNRPHVIASCCGSTQLNSFSSRAS